MRKNIQMKYPRVSIFLRKKSVNTSGVEFFLGIFYIICIHIYLMPVLNTFFGGDFGEILPPGQVRLQGPIFEG